MVSFGAFWVAISYRLAACFTRIGSTCGIMELKFIGDRSGILGTIITLWGKLRKMTKIGQKLIKTPQKLRWRDAIVFKVPVLPE